MKFVAPFNTFVAFAAMLGSIYNHELGTAAAWSSAIFGWLIVSLMAWEV